jgi:hypothetical protein
MLHVRAPASVTCREEVQACHQLDELVRVHQDQVWHQDQVL